MTRPLALPILLSALAGCSTALDLGSNDAGVPYDADCKPGTYSGTYACTASSGTPFQMAGKGAIAVTLVPAGARMLALTPDASLSSSASGFTSNSVLSGVLDCPSRKLTGAISGVAFSSSTVQATITGTGVLDAVYDADASPPALVQGTLVPPSALSTTCTWNATLE
jgi:hypothetical protein